MNRTSCFDNESNIIRASLKIFKQLNQVEITSDMGDMKGYLETGMRFHLHTVLKHFLFLDPNISCLGSFMSLLQYFMKRFHYLDTT